MLRARRTKCYWRDSMPPSLEEQIAYQRQFMLTVAADPNSWPARELDFAQGILESLEALHEFRNRPESWIVDVPPA